MKERILFKSMTKSFIFVVGLLFFASKAIATLPDSLELTDKSFAYLNSYSYKYLFIKHGHSYIIYLVYSSVKDKKGEKILNSRKRVGSVPEKNINQLQEEISSENFRQLELVNFGYDKDWIIRSTELIFQYVKKEYHNWTGKQEKFVKEKLSDIANYESALKRVILNDGYIPISKHSGATFETILYYPNNKKQLVLASENVLGFPWTIDGRESFNPKLPVAFYSLIPQNKSFNRDRFKLKSNLMADLAKQIFEDKCRSEMSELASLAFEREIDELKKSFQIIEAKEYAYFGRYIESDSQTFRITLKSPVSFSGIYVQYFISRQGSTLYSRDSLLKAFPAIRDRIQGIKFLMDFILADTARRIDICYFDNKAITDYHIDGFNKNPVEWKKHEQWIKSLEWYKTSNIKPGFDIEESIQTSQQNNCGCNFRYDNKYLEQSIFFELIDEYKNTSIWLLLPDGTPVLWYFQGQNAYKYSYRDYKTKGRGVQYACRKFTANGGFKIE
ncbi:MAG: hypothetical protein Q8941_08240 [Bacteroidota bacterium]|nr:hypothetical protein [Bacteroidota bacterium]